MYRGEANADLNECIDAGIYRLDKSSFINSPLTTLYGVIVCFRDSYSYIGQIIFDNSSSRKWIRTGIYTKKVFSEWTEL